MGIGSPEGIIEAVSKGIDIFDSALPTRIARNGALFTRLGRVNISNSIYSRTQQPLDPDCACYTCQTFSAAYLHHLFRCDELLAYRLTTIHNLSFLSNLMHEARVAILDNTFSSFKDSFLKSYKPTNEQVRLEQKQKWLKTRSK